MESGLPTFWKKVNSHGIMHLTGLLYCLLYGDGDVICVPMQLGLTAGPGIRITAGVT